MFSLHFRVCKFKKSIRGPGAGVPLWRMAGAPTANRGHARRSDARPEPALTTGGWGNVRRSGVQPEFPMSTGVRVPLWQAVGAPHREPGSCAPLWSGRSLPCPPGTGIAHAALACGWSPPPGGLGGALCSGTAGASPAHQGPGSRTLHWRAAGAPPPTGGRGCTHRSGAQPEPPLPTRCACTALAHGCLYLHVRVCRFQKRYIIFTLFLTGLYHFCLCEKTVFVKQQLATDS